MSAPHRLLFQPHNAIARAALSATSVRPSRAVRPLPLARSGSAVLSLAGAYTASEGATLEVEAVAGGVAVASAPRFTGVGNGRLVIGAVEASALAQSLTFTLASIGIKTEHAALDVGGVRIVARAPGAAGNAIRITVTPQLTATETGVATLAEWPAGQATQTAAVWETLAGEPLRDGRIALADTPRVRFGAFPTVYRVYKTWEAGVWRTGLSPAPAMTIPTGTRAQRISGGYDLTVGDGTTTETYSGLVTLYDALQALAGSALVRVDGVLVDDRTPGGAGAIDVPQLSGAYVAGIRGDVTPLDVAAPAASASTQTIDIRCIDASVRGLEVWSVTGTVSGRLPNAVTGVPYASSAVSFTIPTTWRGHTGEAGHAAAQVAALESSRVLVRLIDRTDAEAQPRVCARAAAGARARSTSVRFVYRRRPSVADCPCPSIPTFSTSILGLGRTSVSQGEAMAGIDPAYQDRLRQLYAWRDGLVRANTSIFSGTAPVTVPPSSTPSQYGLNVWVRNDGGDVVGMVDFGGFATQEAAIDEYEAYWSGGATVVSGMAFTGVGVAFSNGRSGSFRLNTADPNIGTKVGDGNMAGWTAEFAGYTYGGGGTTPGYTIPGSSPAYLAVPYDLDFVHEVTRILASCLAQIYTVPVALTAWDAVFASAQTDCELVRTADPQGHPASPRFLDRFRSACDTVLVEAGIVPKSDASGQLAAAPGYWQDDPSATHWWVDESGTYLPVFTNKIYYSVRTTAEGEVVSTQEFGLFIGCGCESLLQPGDTVEVTLNGALVGGDEDNAVGRQAQIDIVSLGSPRLRGGVSGDDSRTWSVRGSVSGELTPYIVPPSGAPSHTVAGVTVHIENGSIPFELGDAFSLDVESGQLRWRLDDGPWSSPVDAAASTVVAHGLELQMRAGAAPSLVAGDRWRWALLQPHAPSHVKTPDDDVWAYAGDSAHITATWDTPQLVHIAAAVLRDVPDGASVTLSVSADGGTWSAPMPMTRCASMAVAVLPTPVAARGLRLVIADAPSGAVRWWWAGTGVTTQRAARVSLRRQWALFSGDGINPAVLCAGSGLGGRIEWEMLADAEARAILDAVHAHQRAGWPLVLLPQIAHPQDAAFVRVDVSGIDVVDEFDFHPNDAQHRLLRMSLPLQSVYQ